MTECGNCSQEKPAKKAYKFYTAIQRLSTIKTGYKKYETKTQYIGFKEHTYSLCADCIRRYSIFSLVFWLPTCFVITPLIMWLLYSQSEASGNEELLMACAISPPIIFFVAFMIWVTYLNLNSKLVKKAIAARKETKWENDLEGLSDLHQGYKADSSHNVLGFTEVQYKKLQKKI